MDQNLINVMNINKSKDIITNFMESPLKSNAEKNNPGLLNNMNGSLSRYDYGKKPRDEMRKDYKTEERIYEQIIKNCLNVMKLKKLYFHENLKSLTGWLFSKGIKCDPWISFDIILPKDFLKNFDINKTEAPRECLLLRSVKINFNNNNVEETDEYPLGMKLTINNLDFTNLLPRFVYSSSGKNKHRINIPTIMNEFLRKFNDNDTRENVFRVCISYDKKENNGQTYAFNIFTSTQKSVSKLSKEYKEVIKVDDLKFKNDIIELFSNKDDIELENTKVSLLSSVSFQRIKIPFRGRNCKHISPDDLKEYFENNYKEETWKCKICKNNCTPDDIFIDSFYYHLINFNKEIKEIELNSASIVELFHMGNTLKSFGNNDSKNNDVIVIDRDDEEKECIDNNNIKYKTLGKNISNNGKLWKEKNFVDNAYKQMDKGVNQNNVNILSNVNEHPQINNQFKGSMISSPYKRNIRSNIDNDFFFLNLIVNNIQNWGDNLENIFKDINSTTIPIAYQSTTIKNNVSHYGINIEDMVTKYKIIGNERLNMLNKILVDIDRKQNKS